MSNLMHLNLVSPCPPCQDGWMLAPFELGAKFLATFRSCLPKSSKSKPHKGWRQHLLCIWIHQHDSSRQVYDMPQASCESVFSKRLNTKSVLLIVWHCYLVDDNLK